MRHLAWISILAGFAACANARRGGSGVGGDDDSGQHDANNGNGADDANNGNGADDANNNGTDDANGNGNTDANGNGNTDANTNGGADAMAILDAPISTGPITGGPCLSGHAGQTAYRIRWAGNGAGSTAYPVYEKNGLPDHSRDHTGAYGYQIGFNAVWDDPFLGAGGVVLDGSDFVDIELSTSGLSSISNATLSIYGRSFNTTASGSYNWQTFDGTGSTPTNFVSNVAPYQWYSADMTTELSPGDNGVLLRIKSGPSSDSLVVNRIELCLTAN